MAGGSILIIDRGDLPSLTATALEPDRSRVILWHPREDDAAARARLAMVRRHAQSLAVADLRLSDVIFPADDGRAVDPASSPCAHARSMLLACGAIAASELGCSKLIWPIAGGDNVEAMTLEVERAALVSALIDLGAPMSTLVIDQPFIDLNDSQIVELADDSGGRLHEFWPCEETGAGPCGQCGSCTRWWAAFEQVGIPWPWSPAAV